MEEDARTGANAESVNARATDVVNARAADVVAEAKDVAQKTRNPKLQIKKKAAPEPNMKRMKTTNEADESLISYYLDQ